MANYSEKIANAVWENLTPGQKESMEALSREVLKALEAGNQSFPSIMENASRQTAGVLSNARGNFQNVGGSYSSSDSQNRVLAPCVDTKALAEATDRGKKPLATPLAVSAAEFEQISHLDTVNTNVSNTNQSLINFARDAIAQGGAPKLLEFVQAHNHVMRERDVQNNAGQYQGFNGQDSGHGL